MQYKVLALDLDGTLTNTDKIITPRTKAALQKAAQRGVCIVLVSVPSRSSARTLYCIGDSPAVKICGNTA